MTEYLMEHWDGWMLHALLAALLTHPFITNIYPRVAFAMHLIFWPVREMWQHGGFEHIWTAHRIWEFTAPILASFVVLMIDERWPYRRRKR